MGMGRCCAIAAMTSALATCLGCGSMTYCQSSIGGRAVVVSGGILGTFDSYELRAGNTDATIKMAGRTLHLTENELAWGDAYRLDLPRDWQRIEFVQAGRQIEVVIDGAHFTKIPPSTS